MTGQPTNAQPEYEDCRALAEAQEVPLKEVIQAALAAAQDSVQPVVAAHRSSSPEIAAYRDEPAYLDE
jgi:hypothetical protein